MKIKRKAREIALKTLFAVEVGKNNFADALYVSRNEDPVALNYAINLVKGVLEKKMQIDETICSLLENWSFDRISEVDKQILRLAIYEIKDIEGVDDGVVVYEMVELAKKYGDINSKDFVNGILRSFLRGSRSESET